MGNVPGTGALALRGGRMTCPKEVPAMNHAAMTGAGGSVLSISTGRHRRRSRVTAVSFALVAVIAGTGGVVGAMQSRHAATSPALAGPFSQFPR
jgi:hypothetical protein